MMGPLNSTCDSMKIAIFLNEFPAASETFVLNQIVGLLKRGHDVHIYAREAGGLTVGACHADIGRYHLLNIVQYQPRYSGFARLISVAPRLIRWGWRDPASIGDSLNIFRYRRSAVSLRMLNELLPPAGMRPTSYDVIHCHFGPNGKRAIAWRRFGVLKGPIVTTFHGYDANKLPRMYGVSYYKSLFRDGDTFTVGTEFMKGRILALGAPQDRVVKLPMGVDLSRFNYAERAAPIGGKIQLLTVARLVEVKGITFALLAVASLKERIPNIRYQIIGDGPLRAELEALARNLNISDIVEFLGTLPQEDVITALKAAHIFILPSIVTPSGEEENQGVVLAEAHAVGLPVIASRIGGIYESIRDGESGILVAPSDPKALASAILRLANDPQVCIQMGKVGRIHVEAFLELERLNDHLLDIYRSVGTRPS